MKWGLFGARATVTKVSPDRSTFEINVAGYGLVAGVTREELFRHASNTQMLLDEKRALIHRSADFADVVGGIVNARMAGRCGVTLPWAVSGISDQDTELESRLQDFEKVIRDCKKIPYIVLAQ